MILDITLKGRVVVDGPEGSWTTMDEVATRSVIVSNDESTALRILDAVAEEAERQKLVHEQQKDTTHDMA